MTTKLACFGLGILFGVGGYLGILDLTGHLHMYNDKLWCVW